MPRPNLAIWRISNDDWMRKVDLIVLSFLQGIVARKPVCRRPDSFLSFPRVLVLMAVNRRSCGDKLFWLIFIRNDLRQR